MHLRITWSKEQTRLRSQGRSPWNIYFHSSVPFIRSELPSQPPFSISYHQHLKYCYRDSLFQPWTSSCHASTSTVTGAGPKRNEPIECFRPVHQAYSRPHNDRSLPITSTIRAQMPLGAMRTVDNAYSDDGTALVYDRDVVTTWRLPSSMAAYEVYF